MRANTLEDIGAKVVALHALIAKRSVLRHRDRGRYAPGEELPADRQEIAARITTARNSLLCAVRSYRRRAEKLADALSKGGKA